MYAAYIYVCFPNITLVGSFLKLQCMYLFGPPDQFHIEMCVIDLSFSLNASLRRGSSGRYLLCALFLCSLFLSFDFASFTFNFVHQPQTAENTIFLIMENIFYSGLDGTVILHTCLFCSQTEIKRTIRSSATRKWQSDICIVHL